MFEIDAKKGFNQAFKSGRESIEDLKGTDPDLVANVIFIVFLQLVLFKVFCLL